MISYLNQLLNGSSIPDDWTIEEDLELLMIAKNPSTTKRRWSKTQCADRYRCIVTMVFKDFDSSLEEGIKIALGRFYEGNRHTIDGFTKEKMERMVLQYFLEGKGLNTGLEEPLEKCETQFNTLLEWICKSRKCSLPDLFQKAIADYWKEKDGQDILEPAGPIVKAGLKAAAQAVKMI